MEVGQVGVFILDDVGDEMQQRLRAVSRLGLQQLKSTLLKMLVVEVILK